LHDIFIMICLVLYYDDNSATLNERFPEFNFTSGIQIDGLLLPVLEHLIEQWNLLSEKRIGEASYHTSNTLTQNLYTHLKSVK